MKKSEFEFDLFPVYMGTIKKAMQKGMTADIGTYGLSSMHAMHLMMLYKNKKGLTLNEMTCGTDVDKANTTRVINDLEEKGYVFKDKESNQVRGYRVLLSTEGIKIAEEFSLKGKKRRKVMFSEFDDQDKEDLIRIMEKLLKGVSKMEGQNDRDI